MAKESGGTRNYRGNAKVLTTRRSEYDRLMATGNYDSSRSSFDASGGFYITHKEHNPITDTNVDKSDIAVVFLAKKGYRVFLDNEKTTISDNGKKKDGRIEKLPMDIKTINGAGGNTIKSALEKASKQGAKAVILYQNTTEMDANYVKEQLYGKNGFIMKSPINAVSKVDWVIVVGSNGHVHRHNLAKERWRRK